MRGQLSSVLGSNGDQAGTTGSVEVGAGNWLFWGQGGGQRQGDYDTPDGAVENSKSRLTNAAAGGGWYGDKFFASLEYLFNDSRYGIPFAAELEGGLEEEEEKGEQEGEEAIDVAIQRHWVRLGTGLRNLEGPFESFQVNLSYTNFEQDEIEVIDGIDEDIATSFDNQQFIYRGVVEQQHTGPLSGTFGVWGLVRDYDVAGAEALSPPVDQNAFAVFGLEELAFERVRLQLGGRIERVSYAPPGTLDRQRTAGTPRP